MRTLGKSASAGSSSSGATSVLDPPDPAATKRRKRSKGNIVAGIVALVTLLGLLAAPFWLLKAGLGLKHHQDTNNFVAANHPGDLVHDSTVSFVVNTEQCSTTPIGEHKSQHGQFCQIGLTVRNDGPLPMRFDAISQRAMGSRGGFYIPDPSADALVNKASDTIPDSSDPGNSLEASLTPPVVAALEPGQSHTYTVVYDLPTDTKLTQIDLHANEYSHGSPVLFSR